MPGTNVLAATIDALHANIAILDHAGAIIVARKERDHSRQSLNDAEQEHIARLSHAYDELGQRLAAISLAAQAIEEGGYAANAIALIYMAVDEARHELRAMRYQAAGARPTN